MRVSAKQLAATNVKKEALINKKKKRQAALPTKGRELVTKKRSKPEVKASDELLPRAKARVIKKQARARKAATLVEGAVEKVVEEKQTKLSATQKRKNDHDAFLVEQKEIFDEFAPTEALPEDHTYSRKDFNWRPLKVKGVDGGVYRCYDPVLKWVGYDANFVIDPVSKLPMKRVSSYDVFASIVEWMFKADRRKWLRQLEKDAEGGSKRAIKALNKVKDVGTLPIEYYGIYSYGKWAVITSFGADGQAPCDVKLRETEAKVGDTDVN